MKKMSKLDVKSPISTSLPARGRGHVQLVDSRARRCASALIRATSCSALLVASPRPCWQVRFQPCAQSEWHASAVNAAATFCLRAISRCRVVRVHTRHCRLRAASAGKNQLGLSRYTAMAAPSSAENPNPLHKIHTSDPLVFKRYVNRGVSITTLDSRVHTGFAYTVDPVSESFVLVQPKGEGEREAEMKIILGPSIRSVDCSFDTPAVPLPEMFVAPRIHLAQEELDRRKDLVTKLFMENRFSVGEEEGILCIEDSVKIEPPYQSENCICSNSVILNRIQTLLTRIEI